MGMRYFQTAGVIVLGLLVCGCSGPVITVRHHLGGAVDMGIEPGAYHVGQFQVRPEAFTDLPTYAKNSLEKQLTDYDTSTSVGLRQSDLVVDGVINVTAEDFRGVRHIRQWNAQRHNLEEVEVPSLRREVAVKVNFVICRSDEYLREVTLETARSFSSNEDPLIRGDEGLLRPDDPERTPAVDTIARKLIDECIQDFIAMIHPYEVTAEIPLHYVWGENAAGGLRVAREGDYVGAGNYFRAALDSDPDNSDLHFNLAVVTEAAGDLAEAEKHYRQVLEQRPADESARSGLERVVRLRRIQDYERKLPSALIGQ